MIFFKKHKRLPPPSKTPATSKHEVTTTTPPISSKEDNVLASKQPVTTAKQDHRLQFKKFAFKWKRKFSTKASYEQANFYDNLEELLIEADVGGKETLKLIERLRTVVTATERDRNEFLSETEKIALFKTLLSECVKTGQLKLAFHEARTPVIVLLGVNGAGKTTTLAKLAALFKDDYKIVIGACDTFRAAAIEQLTHWADLLGVSIVKKNEGADSAAVAYDTIESTLAQKKGFAFIDTAGRLHNKETLMNELQKLFRVLAKFGDRVSVLKLLVVDVTLGQNVLAQISTFHEKIHIDGMILTKLDTQARGGSILALSQALAIPIYYYTFGEDLTALEPFDKASYIDALFSDL
ncbi:signal recognition particle receptor FtsY [Spirochaetota bacterium]|nr:signal recognition particle receptor FtsY [Spirochaetota bacterium]